MNHGIVNNTVETITAAGQKDANLKIVPAGTFVMAITGLEAPGTRGNSSILGVDTTVNQSVMALFPNENLDTQFLFQWYQKVGEEYGISYTQGTKQQSYNAELIKILPFTLPDNVEEQQRIAKLLFKLDDLIAANQRKVDGLKVQKSVYLEQIFNQNIRFSGYDEPWVQRKVRDLGNVVRANINPQDYPDEKFTEYSMPAYDQGQKPHLILGSSMQSSRLKISGEVLLINKLNVRQKRVWLVTETKENAVASGEFMPFTSSHFDLSFMRQLVLSDKTTRDFESMSSGTSNSQKRITPTDFLNYKISVPASKVEQLKIGKILDNIDNLIAARQRKVDLLIAQKSAYLQKMFI